MSGLFLDFFSRNIPVIPLKNGIPQVEWSRFFDSPPSAEDAALWDAAGYTEVALLCGKVSGIIGLDIDTDDTSAIYALAGETPCRKKGSKGFTAFYKYNAENSRSWGGGHGVGNICELLSDKRLTTIPPSPHRKTGKPYVWMDSDDLSNLPEINADVFTFLEAKYPRKVYSPKHYSGEHESIDLSQAKEILTFISSDCSREQWILVGMALRDEYGDAANGLWHEWSSKAATRYDARAAQSAWRSFGGQGVGIGSLIYTAKQAGWERKREPAQEWTGEIIINEPEPEPEPEKISDTFPPHLLNAPNLLGEVASWIESRATIPQPALSLAASISILGALLGHKIRSETDIRTNIYVLGVAESGQGKENARSCIKVLLRDIGKPQYMLGSFASDVGLTDALYNGGGCGVSLIDEFGDYLASITGKQSGGWEKKITAAMKEIYSSSNSVHLDKQRANQDGKETKRRDIDQPCLCIYATTTPKQFTDALNGKDVLDGFFPRWLIFETSYTREKRRRGGFMDPPQRLLSLLSQVASMPSDTREQSADTVLLPAIVPQTLRFTREAYKILDAFEALCDDMQEAEVKSGGGCNAIWARAHVTAIKLAMIASDYVEIRELETSWACEVVEYLTRRAVHLAKTNIADSEYHRLMNEVLQYVQKSPNMERSRRDVVRRFQRMEIRKIDEALRHLCESESLRSEERSNLRGKPSIFYLA